MYSIALRDVCPGASTQVKGPRSQPVSAGPYGRQGRPISLSSERLGVTGTRKDFYQRIRGCSSRRGCTGGCVSGGGCALPRFLSVGNGFRFSTLQLLKHMS